MNYSPALRRLTRWFYHLSAITLILMALTSLLVSLLLPLAERHPEVISRWLTDRTGLPVQFDHIRTGWTRRGPLLQLDGLAIGHGEDAVRIGRAEILIAQYAGLLPGRSFTELRLRRLNLTLERHTDARWQVRGLPGAAASETDPLSALGKLGELQVIHARLGIIAPALGIDAIIPDVDLRVRVEGPRARIAVHARMAPEAAPLRATLDLDRRSGNARAHAAIQYADLAIWSPLLRVDGLMLAEGDGQIDAWAELHGFRLSALTTAADLDHLLLQRISDADQVAFGQVNARLFWRNENGQWRFDAPQLRIGDPAQPQILDGLMLAGGAQLALHAARIDAGPLLAIAALSPRLPSGVRQWLKAAKPDASAHDIALSGSAEGGLRGTLKVSNLHFASVDQTPGVSGLGGRITLDMHGAMLELDPGQTVQFNWPTGFGVPHHLNLNGTLAAWWSGVDGGVRLMTPALRVDADGYAADLRGGMWFHGDGRRPRIDLAAALDGTDIPVAKRFWVRSNMSQNAIDWLDMALVSGALRNGRALVSGELADWPFDSREGEHVRGIFEARGELAGAQVRFQPDWPVMEQFNGPVRFFNDGFSLRGKARIGGIALSEVRAGLPHYSDSELSVNARASGDMHDWLVLLRQSPLNASHGEILDNLDASGEARSSFSMTLALGGDDGPSIRGEAELDAAQLTEQRWALALGEVRGTVRYDERGFASGPLPAVYDGRTGIMTLRAGEGHVHDVGHAFEADMQMELAAANLIARAPQLDWLAPHVNGRSHWTVAVAVNAASAETVASGVLTLHSDLVGTALTLPAPLDKPADTALPTRIHSSLPWGAGEVQVRLGERMALNARTTDDHTGTSIAFGRGHMPAPAPENGLTVSGEVPVLDAAGWLALGAFAPGTAAAAPAPTLNLRIGQILLPGAGFAEVNVSTKPAADATVLTLQSPALAGRVHWPAASDLPLKAEFARVHWPALVRSVHSAETDAAPSTRTPGITDPRQLPPLELGVADLRLGEVALGEALVHTRKTRAGLEIKRLRIRGPQQSIDVRGEWTGTGAAAITRLELDITSRDLGPLLTALGLGSQLRGGTGTLRLGGHWPGSPLDFAAAHLTGQMSVDMRDGQLLEVEPGAGRVLGLLSVAQLPRRLLLDFRDFFGKGFGFNEIGGEIHAEGGIARTEGLRINGPAAKIRISGSSDLSARTHEQTIEISPRTGNLLTAVGAVAGGPLGAAVGAAANAVLKGPLGEVGARTYLVTGPWQEPKVEVLSHDILAAGPEPAAAEDADAAGDQDPPADPAPEDAAQAVDADGADPAPRPGQDAPATPPSAQTPPPPVALPRPVH